MADLPAARGPLSRALLDALRGAPGSLGALDVVVPADVLGDDDLQLALYCCYELHYRGFAGVDERWEWDLGLLALRQDLEAAFEDAVVALAGPVEQYAEVAPGQMDVALRAVAAADDGPSLSQFLAREGTLEQVRELVVHRSAYQLKEADPHTWVMPRLEGRPKAALVEIQSDEYGSGRPERIHARLFADMLEALGIDATYGAHVDALPATALATVNLMSLCGLHRRLRGAIVGHLAAYEMGSSIPSRRYAEALRRNGVEDEQALEFFLEHVEADAVHESLAAVDLAGGLAEQDAALGPWVQWGARALAVVDGRWATDVMAAWADGRTSLRGPVRTLADVA